MKRLKSVEIDHQATKFMLSTKSAGAKMMVSALNKERQQAQTITDTLHGEVEELKAVLKKFGTQVRWSDSGAKRQQKHYTAYPHN